jgi:hypothetical protein
MPTFSKYFLRVYLFSCQFEVERALPSICKLELEFNTFEWGNEVEVKDPESENNPCPEASLVIGSGPSIVLATFCGNHSGQTREVDFPPNAETVFFTFDSKDLNNRTKYVYSQVVALYSIYIDRPVFY